jgi:hypothetical protein
MSRKLLHHLQCDLWFTTDDIFAHTKNPFSGAGNGLKKIASRTLSVQFCCNRKISTPVGATGTPILS